MKCFWYSEGSFTIFQEKFYDTYIVRNCVFDWKVYVKRRVSRLRVIAKLSESSLRLLSDFQCSSMSIGGGYGKNMNKFWWPLIILWSCTVPILFVKSLVLAIRAVFSALASHWQLEMNYYLYATMYWRIWIFTFRHFKFHCVSVCVCVEYTIIF